LVVAFDLLVSPPNLSYGRTGCHGPAARRDRAL